MPSLRELQTRMMLAVLHGGSESALDHIVPPAASTLQLYARAVSGNFEEALRATFPVVRRLVGETYFRQTARRYQLAHPSSSGDLADAGASFSDFLARLHPTGEFEYLADVARFEWLVQEVLLAAEHAPLSLEKMAGVPASAYDALRFALHPALRLFEAKYPVSRIWEVNAREDREPDLIDLGSGAERLMLMRHRMQLTLQHVSVGEYRLLYEFRRATPFAAAVEAAAACDAHFDATQSLQRLVRYEAIVDFLY